MATTPDRKANVALKLSLTGTFRDTEPSAISRSATERRVIFLFWTTTASFPGVVTDVGVDDDDVEVLFTDFKALYTNAMDCMRNSPYVRWPTALRRGVSLGQSATSVSTSSATSAMESQDDSGLARKRLTRLTNCAATEERVALNSSNEDDVVPFSSSPPPFLRFSRSGEAAPLIFFAAVGGVAAASMACAFEHSSKTTAMASNVRDQFARKNALPSPVALNVLSFIFSSSSLLPLPPPPPSSFVAEAKLQTNDRFAAFTETI